MVVWLYRDDGTFLRLEDPFRPRLYAGGPEGDLRRLVRVLRRARLSCRWEITRMREFWSGERRLILALDVDVYGTLPMILERLPVSEPRLSFYNCDLLLPQYYLYCRHLFPFGQCEVRHRGATITHIRALESAASRHSTG
jgi:hypothetical protein